MAQQIQVQWPNGEISWVEVALDGPSNVSHNKIIQKLDLDELRGVIRGVADSMRSALDSLRPDEVAVEFGVELAVKSGKLTSVLAEASGTASVKVTVAWRRGDTSTSAALDADSDAGGSVPDAK